MATIRSEDSVWSYHENSSAALTDTVVQAAPGLGLSIYITDIIFSVSVVTAFSLLLEAGTTTTILGPFYSETIGAHTICFHTPKKVTENTALTITSTGALAHSIEILGFIGKS